MADNSKRPLRAYTRLSANSGWWAGVEFADKGPLSDEVYIVETPCLTEWGARWKAQALLRKIQHLQRTQPEALNGSGGFKEYL